MADPEYLRRLAKGLADEGKLIEAGFVGFRLGVMHPDSPTDQVVEMRLAFMAGAQHLFSSIMTILEDGNEATPADLKRLDLIQKELNAVEADMRARAKARL